MTPRESSDLFHLGGGSARGGESTSVGTVQNFEWPLNDARVWREGDVHQVLITVSVGEEKVDKDGKRRRPLDVMGFD